MSFAFIFCVCVVCVCVFAHVPPQVEVYGELVFIDSHLPPCDSGAPIELYLSAELSDWP